MSRIALFAAGVAAAAGCSLVVDTRGLAEGADVSDASGTASDATDGSASTASDATDGSAMPRDGGLQAACPANLPDAVYVHASLGDDAADGSSAHPLRSLTKALAATAGVKKIICLRGGQPALVYSAATTNEAPQLLITQDGVEIRGDGASSVRIEAATPAPRPAARVTGLNIKLSGFALNAATVSLEGSGATLSAIDLTGGIEARTTGNVTLTDVAIHGAQKISFFLGTGSAHLERVKVDSTGGTDPFVRGIYAYDSARNVELVDCEVVGAKGAAIDIENGASSLLRVHVATSTNGLLARATATSVNVDDCRFTGGDNGILVFGGTEALRVRRTLFEGGGALKVVTSPQTVPIDFGTAADPGANTFRANRCDFGLSTSATVYAVGNHFDVCPVRQGAECAYPTLVAAGSGSVDATGCLQN